MQILIEELCKTYRKFPFTLGEAGLVQALDRVTLTIQPGLFGLLGPNGAGKTTLMRIVSTLLEPTSGSVLVDGVDLKKDPQRVRQMIGYLPQEFGFYKRLTAYEFLDFSGSMKCLPSRERQTQIATVLDLVNLAGEKRKPIGTFSGGMKRRLGIAQALLGNPKVLIVDEPTAGLDPEERLRFRNLLAGISGDKVVLLSTHIVADVESACTQLAVISKGQVKFAGSPTDLIGQAHGRVWQLEVNPAEYTNIQQRLRIISYRRTHDGMSIRVLANENPFGRAQCVSSTLEDGYLSLMDADTDSLPQEVIA